MMFKIFLCYVGSAFTQIHGLILGLITNLPNWSHIVMCRILYINTNFKWQYQSFHLNISFIRSQNSNSKFFSDIGTCYRVLKVL